jgi:ComF family protein
MLRVHPIASPLCSCCGVPFVSGEGPEHLCGQCLNERPPFRQARAWAYYQHGAGRLQPVSDAIQHFKYHRDLSVGKTLALLAATYYPFVSESYDIIIPVPLHLERLRWRGFNQSLVLSRSIGTTHRIAIDPFLLERSRPTAPQTQLTGKDRRTNVKGAFTVSSPDQVQDKRVLLIDDVYTSWATVRECAHTLTNAGAQIVDVFTLARAVS